MLRELLDVTSYIARNLPDAQGRDLLNEIRKKEANLPAPTPQTDLWAEFVERVRKVAAFTGAYLGHATGTFYSRKLVIEFGAGDEDFTDLVDNAKNRMLFKKILLEMGFDEKSEIVFKTASVQPQI